MERKNGNCCVLISVGREELTLGSADADASSESESKNKARGFHLSRSKWDPYPWVGSVETNSVAHSSGLRPGDCLLKVDGTDLLGLSMQDIAILIGRDNQVNIQIWRRPQDDLFMGDNEVRNADAKMDGGETAVALQGPLPEVANKLARTVSGVVKTLECPVCLESSAPPVSQCVHGHILCVGCRPKTERCPVCRVRLGQGRCLLADKFHRVLQENFSIPPLTSPSSSENYSLHEKLFGSRKHKNKDTNKATCSKTNSTKPKHLLSKLLSSRSDGKASSTESLPGTTAKSLCNGREFLLKKTYGEHLDRAKSASTGELTVENSNVLPTSEMLNVSERSGSFLSIPQTPVWGGSTESITDFRFACPLFRRGCIEKVTSGTVLEHLFSFHKGPFIHFYEGKAELPYPLPFENDGVYVLHFFEDIFFFQNENLKFWIDGVVSSGKKWEWIIKGQGNSESVRFVNEVKNLQESSASSDENTAVLPESCYNKLYIKLSERKIGEGLNI